MGQKNTNGKVQNVRKGIGIMQKLTEKTGQTERVMFVDHENNGRLLSPVDMKFEHIRLTLIRLNEYEVGENDIKETVAIETLKTIRKDLLERIEELKEEYEESGQNAICNRIMELNEIVSMLQEKVYKISPVDCDW